MRGKANCRFIGGPQDGQTISIPGQACQDTLAVEEEVWIAETADGGAKIMKGRRPRDSKWTTYSVAIYRKQKLEDGGITYHFVRSQPINRCAKVLETVGRRCKNDADEGSTYCRTHKSTS